MGEETERGPWRSLDDHWWSHNWSHEFCEFLQLKKTRNGSYLFSLLPSVSLGGPPELGEDLTDVWHHFPSVSLLLFLPPSLSPSFVTSQSVSCGIREMIKEDSFKYLSSLSLMARQSRWAWRRWELARGECQAAWYRWEIRWIIFWVNTGVCMWMSVSD